MASLASLASPLTLTTVLGAYPHVMPLKDGRVRSSRLILRHVDVSPVNRAFRTMVTELAYDVSELALVTHMLATSFQRPLVGLPIVLMRQSAHALLVCRDDATVRDPRDLAGCVVGVRAYTQTTGVWVRGILQDQFGLDLRRLRWVTFEDAHVDGFRDPPTCTRARPGTTLLGLLQAGEIDAAIGIEASPQANLRPVIADPERSQAEWIARVGCQPINHVLTLKADLARQHPWLASELYGLFLAARAHAPEMAPPTGLETIRQPVELLARFAFEQGITPRAYAADELFVGPIELPGDD